MGAFNFWRHKPETRADIPEEVTPSVSESLIKLIKDPEYMTKEKALQIPTVKACINLIADTISRMAVRLYEQDEDGVKPVEGDERVKLLNGDPYDTLTAKMMWRALLEDYFLGKGAFLYISRQLAKVQALYYVKEDDISLILESVDPIFKGGIYGIQGRRVYPHEMVKFLRTTKDGLVSKSIIEENPLLLSIAYQYMVFELGIVKKGGIKRGFLLSEKNLSVQALSALKKAFREMYADPDQTVILNNGLKFSEAATSNAELQLNDAKEYCAQEICKLFGVPIAMLTGSKTTTSNSAEDKKRFLGTCLAIVEDIQCSLNRDLLLEEEKGERYFAFDTRELTRDSISERYEAYRIGLESNFLQIDEVRRMEDMEPLGIKWIQLKLGNVFYDPETGVVYTPNTNAAMDLEGSSTMNLKDALSGAGMGANRSARANLPPSGAGNGGTV